MQLKTAKKWVLIFMGLSVASCLTGIFVFNLQTIQSAYTGLAAIIFLFIAVGIVFKWCRCPWCNQILFKNMFNVTVCPACNRDLVSGKKKKGKGGRK
ncbi:MAG: hypothetical protein RR314_00820 [Oscillospiraceae bacterium]